MFRSDDTSLGAAGLNELPPYYSRRLQVAMPSGQGSVRGERRQTDADAQAERLFRDFKMGLLTLVVVALLLLAYFWDGDRTRTVPDENVREDVLSFSLRGERRADVVMPARVVPVASAPEAAPVAVAPVRQVAVAAPAPSTTRTRTTRGRIYTVRRGDTLSGIALRFYGNATYWRAILQANRTRLRRPADLRPGMRLVVPAPAGSASARGRSTHLARAGPNARR